MQMVGGSGVHQSGMPVCVCNGSGKREFGTTVLAELNKDEAGKGVYVKQLSVNRTDFIILAV